MVRRRVSIKTTRSSQSWTNHLSTQMTVISKVTNFSLFLTKARERESGREKKQSLLLAQARALWFLSARSLLGPRAEKFNRSNKNSLTGRVHCRCTYVLTHTPSIILMLEACNEGAWRWTHGGYLFNRFQVLAFIFSLPRGANCSVEKKRVLAISSAILTLAKEQKCI